MIQKTRHIPDGKYVLKQLPVIPYLEAPQLFYPLTNPRCPEGELFVQAGDHVKVGQIIGKRKGSFFEQPIHATVSGTVLEEKVKRFDQSGKKVDCVVVENDQKYDVFEAIVTRKDEDIEKLSRQAMVQIIKEAGLVGLGGSAFPSYIKLETKDPIHVVIANGVECEPNLISDYALMMEYPERVIQGLIYAMHGAGAISGIIAIKKKYKEIKERLLFRLNQYTMYDIKIVEVGNYYPQGWEIEVIKNALGIKIPQGEMLSKSGIINFNVSTLESIYQAVKHGLPVLERFISLSGDGIENMNFKARIGTQLSELIILAGGYKEPERKKVLILGGPMMGSNVMSDEVVMTHTTTSLIVQQEEEVVESQCVRCASCVYSCPVHLQPVKIMQAYLAKDKDALKQLKVNHCIECGLCSYVCPSKIPLTDHMKSGKRLVG